MRRTLLFAIICFVFSNSVLCQNGYFGRNKVHYSKFDWHYIQSEHFDVYFDKGQEYLAQFTAEVAESALVTFTKTMRYKLESPIVIVVYNSHNSFQQTNVVDEYMEEGIGGVTELFKNRVVVPFEGDYAKFRHVIRHELVHAVINEMFYGGSLQVVLRRRISLELPLWFNEGLAEYLALEWDTDSDMFMRDAVIAKYLPARISELQGYFAYRGGQSIWWYVSRKYGRPKIGEILERVKNLGSVEKGFKEAIGFDLTELAERWQWDQQQIYWPDVAIRKPVTDFSKPLTNHKKDGSFYNTSPAISPSGDRLVFISNHDGYFRVYLMNVTGEMVDELATGGKTNDFEELHLLAPGISWSPDEKSVAFASKAGAEDAIMLLNVSENETEKLTFGLDGIFFPVWSRQGDKLAFVGIKGKQSDIYAYSLKSKTLTNLTNDIASDSDPIWSPDGEKIYFSSDRNIAGSRVDSAKSVHTYKNKDIYCLSLKSGALERVIGFEGSNETSPVVSSDGKKIFFISDKSGVNNIYEWDMAEDRLRPITNSLSGIYQLSLSHDDNRLVFSSFVNDGFDIFLMRNPLRRDLDSLNIEPTWFIKHKNSETATALEIASSSKDESGNSVVIFGLRKDSSVTDSVASEKEMRVIDSKETDGSYKVKKYRFSFSPDLVYANSNYNTFYGFSGFTYFAFSDLLGDHRLSLATNLLLDLKNSDYGISYFYLAGRVNLGFSGSHTARFVSLLDEYGGSLYRLRVWGLSGMASYPLDRFNRLDFGLTWYDISKSNLDAVEPIERKTALVSAFSYVHDNSLWGFTGPANGSRYSLHLSFSPPLGSDGLSFVNTTFDYRNYLNIARHYTFAVRLAGGGSFGQNPQRFVLGGVESWINYSFDRGYIPIRNAQDFVFLELGVPLRGFNYNAISGSRYGLLNLEFRYPMLGFFQLSALPIWLQNFGGSFFFDAGTAWSKDSDLQFFRKNEEGEIVSRDLLMGMGTGTRIYFLGFLVKLDVAWRWDVSSFSAPKYYLSLGTDF